MTAAAALATSRPQPYGSQSYWNTEIPDAAPSRATNNMMGFLAQTNSPNYVRLAGTSSDGQWGMPIYSGGSDAKSYDVRNNCSLRQPPEFAHVRIPRGARPDP